MSFRFTKKHLDILEGIKSGKINHKRRHVPKDGFSPDYILAELRYWGHLALAHWFYRQGYLGEHPDARVLMQFAT